MRPPQFTFLGTSSALASATRDNTSLVLEAGEVAVLVDCAGSAVHRLRRLGVDPLSLTHVVVTHLHADHASGLPSLVAQLAMLQRSAPLTVVCRPEHVEPLRTLLTIFDQWQRPGRFAVLLAPIGLGLGARAFVSGPLAVSTAPNEHGAMPNFAVRVDVERGGAVVYSSDTQPSGAVVALARGASVLVHEATFAERDRPPGGVATHSSAAEAGQVAARAGVRRLILTHIGAAYHADVARLADEARAHFGGVVEIAEELTPYSF